MRMKSSLLFLALGLFSESLLAKAKPTDVELLYLTKIKPLMSEKCLGCHGEDPEEIKGDYNMLTRESFLMGGESGEISVVPGNPEESYLYELIQRFDEDDAMPPKKADALSAVQVEWFKDWIKGGAPWPSDDLLEGNEEFVQMRTSGGQSEDWSNRRYEKDALWAFQKIQKVKVPQSKGHPIDAFIQEKLDEIGLDAASRANPRDLIKRTYLDLTGFYPTHEEINTFLLDTSYEAYSLIVERLLESNHYGEQMAKHWLDVVRYADTGGYSNDFERPNAWRYRDYVIRSFNNDKPYNRFVMEQIAGDEMKEDNPELDIAVGFLRMGPWEHTGMEVAAVSRQLFLDDVTDIVGKTFLGQPMICAKCHDHKFDPIPTKDFYSMQAIFAPVQFAVKKAPFLDSENTEGKERNLRNLELIIQNSIKEKNEKISDYESNPPLQQAISGLYSKQVKVNQRSLNRYEPYTFSVYNGPLNIKQSRHYLKYETIKKADLKGEVAKVHVLTGGSLEGKAEEVTPGILSAVAGYGNAASQIPNTEDGRRLAFANWLTSPENTLVPRVIVNRVWQQHFGVGIVATANSYGKMGSRPTHPKLLDYLANWFITEGEWSFKKLHKFIMTSKAYQRSAKHQDKKSVERKDPMNQYLAVRQPRRISAEEIYDNLLAATGELNRAIGGVPVFPEINWEVAMQTRLLMGSIAPAYQPSQLKKERHRRSMYAFVRRSLGDPMMEVFNKPTSDLSCAKRDETTVAPQALSLFNSESIYQRALAMGKFIGQQDKTLQGKVTLLYQKIYGRVPNAIEMEKVTIFMMEMLEEQKRFKPKPYQLPKVFKSQHIEEKTGEVLSWEEPLILMKKFERDVVAWQLTPEQRAYAELSRVMFNSNEFLYVY